MNRLVLFDYPVIKINLSNEASSIYDLEDKLVVRSSAIHRREVVYRLRFMLRSTRFFVRTLLQIEVETTTDEDENPLFDLTTAS